MQKNPKCCNCKEPINPDETHLVDMWGRAWCEGCIFDVMSDAQARDGKKGVARGATRDY